MVKSAQPAPLRAIAALLGLVLLGLLLAAAAPAGATSTPSPGEAAGAGTVTETGPVAAGPLAGATAGSGAGISIINGRGTRIRDWPWQVAIAAGGPGTRNVSARLRAFCGGSLIAPDLVITAAHCVADLSRRELRRVEVIGGRTWLSNRIGGSSYVSKRILPYSRNGVPKFADNGRSPWWDVALLKLKRKVPGRPIKLAGASESASFAPGTPVKATGWGVTGPFRQTSSNVLRLVTQVVLPDAVCRRDNGRGYSPKTMICLGGPAGSTSTCFGDSGGPMVARVSTGWRLVGLTSFGDPYCDPAVPSVDTRVSGRAIRAWVRRVSIRFSGVDPVGFGGIPRPRPAWCKVPDLTGRTVVQARRALSRAGCRLGRVRREAFRFGRPGRANTSSLPQGWLAPIGQRIDIWINR
jgi:V8-like Glu-specific endopeptidase